MVEIGARDVARTVQAQGAATAASGGASPAATAAPRELSNVARSLSGTPVAEAMSPIVLAGFVRLGEFALIALVGFVVYAVHVVPYYGVSAYYLATIPALAALAVLGLQAADTYHVHAFRSTRGQLARLAATWSLTFLFAFAIAFFAKFEGMFSRAWIAGWYAFGFAALVVARAMLARTVRRWTRDGRLVRRTAIVGGGDPGESLIASLEAQPDSDLAIVGVFDDRGDHRSPLKVGDKLKLGTVADLVQFARRTRVDLVIFALPVTAETRILDMLKKLWVLPVDIRLSAHAAKLRFRPRAYSYIGNVPTLDVFDRPLADWDVVTKWLFDKVVGTLALVALAPFMALVALAIRLDSKGPVLFRQKRYGFNNELIEVFKFRSMYVEQCDPTAKQLVTKDDPRVTRVGRFIRKTSLDELPQLLNVVFKGNLSLVGPRPHAVHAKAANRLYDEAVDGYFARHRVKPGMTGWAQINGWRGETDTADKIQRRVEHDLYYIENWSPLLDLYILAKTPVALLKDENAY